MPSDPQGRLSRVPPRMNPNREVALKEAQRLIAPRPLSKINSVLVNIRDQNKSIDWARDKDGHIVQVRINLYHHADGVILQAFGKVMPEDSRCRSCKSGNGVFQTCNASPYLGNVAFRLRACANCVWGGRGSLCSLRDDFEAGGGIQPDDRIVEWICEHGGIDYLIATQEKIPTHIQANLPGKHCDDVSEPSRKRKTTNASIVSNTRSDRPLRRRRKGAITQKPASVDPLHDSVPFGTSPSTVTLPISPEDPSVTDSIETPYRLNAGIENYSRVKQAPLSVTVSRPRPGLATVDAPLGVLIEDMVVRDHSLRDTATCELEKYLYRVLAELGHDILVPDCDRSLRDIATLTTHRFERSLFRLLSDFGRELLVYDRRHRLAMPAPAEVEAHIHGGHRVAWPVSDEEWQNPEILQMYRGDFTRWADIITRRLGGIQAVQSQGDDRWSGHDQRYVVPAGPVPSLQGVPESTQRPAATHFTSNGRAGRSSEVASSSRVSVRQHPLSLQELNHGKPSAPVSPLPSENDSESATITGSGGSVRENERGSRRSLSLADSKRLKRGKQRINNVG